MTNNEPTTSKMNEWNVPHIEGFTVHDVPGGNVDMTRSQFSGTNSFFRHSAYEPSVRHTLDNTKNIFEVLYSSKLRIFNVRQLDTTRNEIAPFITLNLYTTLMFELTLMNYRNCNCYIPELKLLGQNNYFGEYDPEGTATGYEYETYNIIQERNPVNKMKAIHAINELHDLFSSIFRITTSGFHAYCNILETSSSSNKVKLPEQAVQRITEFIHGPYNVNDVNPKVLQQRNLSQQILFNGDGILVTITAIHCKFDDKSIPKTPDRIRDMGMAQYIKKAHLNDAFKTVFKSIVTPHTVNTYFCIEDISSLERLGNDVPEIIPSTRGHLSLLPLRETEIFNDKSEGRIFHNGTKDKILRTFRTYFGDDMILAFTEHIRPSSLVKLPYIKTFRKYSKKCTKIIKSVDYRQLSQAIHSIYRLQWKLTKELYSQLTREQCKNIIYSVNETFEPHVIEPILKEIKEWFVWNKEGNLPRHYYKGILPWRRAVTLYQLGTIVEFMTWNGRGICIYDTNEISIEKPRPY